MELVHGWYTLVIVERSVFLFLNKSMAALFTQLIVEEFVY